MTETTLQEYHSTLEELLLEQRNDEVVQHCRHILEYFPRHVATYRQMGRALLASGRYDDAGEVFRRVLSVDPADYHAHLGLSRVMGTHKQGNDAIWHLERAFEQDPNNAALQEQLQDLYREYRGLEQTRFQLTARAVAMQQLRNGLYVQAIETLTRALAQTPGRYDLQVLLAQVQWESGYRIEAAQTALDILKNLPDCLEANRILTNLWLSERRPSDAQRYLSRIQAVDPYLAFEIAQGAPPPDQVVTLTELDYQREASRQLASSNPDWLRSVGDEDENEAVPAAPAPRSAASNRPRPAAGEPAAQPVPAAPTAADDDWLDAMLVSPTDMDSQPQDALLPDEDWLQELDQVQSAASDLTRPVDASQFPMTEDSLAELFGDDDFWNDPDAAAAAEPTDDDSDSIVRNTGLTGLLSAVDNPRTGTGLTGMLAALEGDTAEEADEFAFDDEEDAADDWVRAVSRPTAPLRDPFKKQTTSDLEHSQAQNEDDSLAWLTDPVEAAAADPQQLIDTGGLTAATDDEEFVDPLAWMKASGLEFIEDAPASHYHPQLDLDDAGPISDPHENRPLAWLEDAGIELIDDDIDDRVVKTDDLPSNDGDPLAWMRDSGIELVATDELENLEADNDTLDLGEPESRTASPIASPLDLMRGRQAGDQLDELFDLETMVEQGTETLTGSTGPLTTAQNRQDTMTDQNDDFLPDWLSSSDDEDADGEPGSPTPTAADDLFGMSAALDALSTGAGDFDLDADDDDALDWMREPDLDRSPGLAAAAPHDDDDSLDFDWNALTPAAGETAGASTFDFGDMTLGDDDDALDNDQEATGGDVPEWLSSVATAETPQVDVGSLFDDTGFTWDADAEAESGVEAIGTDFDFAAVNQEDAGDTDDSGALPDWLSNVRPSTPAIPAGAPMFGSDADTDSVDDELDLDFLTSTTAGRSTSESVSGFDFGGTDDTDDEFSLEPASEVPDWLSGVSFGSDDEDEDEDSREATIPVPLSFALNDEPDETDDFGFEFLTEDEADQVEPDESEAEQPDWLAGIGNSSGAANPTSQGGMTPDWLAGVSFGNDDDEDQDQDDSGAFDLDYARNQDRSPVGADDDTGFEFDLGMLTDSASADDEAAVPDWLSGVGAAAGSDDDEDLLSLDLHLDDEDDLVTADSLLEDNAEDALDFSWELNTDDEHQPAAASVSGSHLTDDDDDVPDWLAGVQMDTDEPDAVTASAGVTDADDDDVPDWLSAVGAPQAATSAPTELDLDALFTGEDDALEAMDDADLLVTDDLSDDLFFEDEEPVPADVRSAADETDFDDLFGSDEDQAETTEESMAGLSLEPEMLGGTPASNAPDWLNAMVPGLDLDYSSEEEAAERAGIPTGERARSDFRWLNSIVEEELAPPLSIPEPVGQKPPARPAAPVTPAAPAKPRGAGFSFSRPPAWLRRLRAEPAAPPSSGDTASLLEDDDDLPPWLDFDGEDQ